MVDEGSCSAWACLWFDRYASFESYETGIEYFTDKFTGLGIFLDTYANSRHAYSFPRIVAMLGDGQTGYDHDKDGDANNVGACSVSYHYTR